MAFAPEGPRAGRVAPGSEAVAELEAVGEGAVDHTPVVGTWAAGSKRPGAGKPTAVNVVRSRSVP